MKLNSTINIYRGLVLLSATMITSFMLKSHDSSLITKMKGGQVKQPESVSLDTASVSKFGVIPGKIYNGLRSINKYL